MKRILDFQNPHFQAAFLEPLECFIPRRDSAKQIPKEVQLFFTYVLFRLGNVYWTFKIPTFRRPFWDPPNVLSPEGTAKAETNGVHFDSFHFNCGLRRVFDTFKITTFRRPFWNLENVLSPGGRLRTQLPRGPIEYIFPFYWCRKRYWHFQNHHFQAAFLKSWKCFIPRRDVCLHTPVGVQLFLLMFYFGLEKL